ncbi:MAG: rhodanese-like domain-containing protein [Gelidibacter sp.]
MAKQVTYIILFLIAFSTNAQDSLSELLNTYNTKTVPYISSQELAMPKTKAIILDAREQKEFEVSHLKDAIFVGYNTFDLEQTISQLNNKQQTIVVYCSLGIRSEAIAEKLKRAGYTNVFNLYGGIFEWKNEDFPILDSKGKETDSVHTFSKSWSKWLSKGVKVYD